MSLKEAQAELRKRTGSDDSGSLLHEHDDLIRAELALELIQRFAQTAETRLIHFLEDFDNSLSYQKMLNQARIDNGDLDQDLTGLYWKDRVEWWRSDFLSNYEWLSEMNQQFSQGHSLLGFCGRDRFETVLIYLVSEMRHVKLWIQDLHKFCAKMVLSDDQIIFNYLINL